MPPVTLFPRFDGVINETPPWARPQDASQVEILKEALDKARQKKRMLLMRSPLSDDLR